jgi:hypothetical protein
MRYSELFAITKLLGDIRMNREVEVDLNTKIDLAEVENVFGNIITDIDKQKTKSNEDIMIYQIRIEVKK